MNGSKTLSANTEKSHVTFWITEHIIVHRISETFLIFSIIFIHHKLDGSRLLSPEIECKIFFHELVKDLRFTSFGKEEISERSKIYRPH